MHACNVFFTFSDFCSLLSSPVLSLEKRYPTLASPCMIHVNVAGHGELHVSLKSVK